MSFQRKLARQQFRARQRERARRFKAQRAREALRAVGPAAGSRAGGVIAPSQDAAATAESEIGFTGQSNNAAKFACSN
jgi:hypothetical protein